VFHRRYLTHFPFADAVRAIVKKHGFNATFSPKAFADQAGSASHIHFSFRDIKTGENTYPDWNEPTGISKHGQAFMAGILEHLTTLTAVTLPSAASQFRVVDSAWAGVYTAWGVENKETPLRVTNDTQGRVNNLEIKCIDGTSNVYLAMGAILAAGLDGMERNLTLGPNVQCDPADLSPEERAKLKISKIPNTFKSSLESFAANPLWKKAMGEDMQRVFLLNKQYEMKWVDRRVLSDTTLPNVSSTTFKATLPTNPTQRSGKCTLSAIRRDFLDKWRSAASLWATVGRRV
jgi:glutamine synthetase